MAVPVGGEEGRKEGTKKAVRALVMAALGGTYERTHTGRTMSLGRTRMLALRSNVQLQTHS